MSQKITMIKRVSATGEDCPDGDTCPTLWRTEAGTLIVQGFPVIDPETLRQLNLPEGEMAVEVPGALWVKP